MLLDFNLHSIFFSLILQITCSSSENALDLQCGVCNEMVDKFKKKISQTENHGFGGGNTDWEESRLGSYSKSESRLIEILEGVCENVSKESTCHAMVEKHESDIYDWWFKKTSEQPDIKHFLCIDRLQVCCPEKTYGANCKDCPGGKENPCNGHGTCTGSGTRTGSGKCECHNGYEGDLCETCGDGYYDAGNLTCTKCDESCENSCSGPGPKKCDDCKEGWIMDDDQGCKDKNECEDDVNICGTAKFCVNTIGSFQCKECHESCKDNCSGEGSKLCQECKTGYVKDLEGCNDVDECSSPEICEAGTYCSNTIGSYKCEACHESCASECTGPGNNACQSCKEGYRLVGDECRDSSEEETDDSNDDRHKEL